MREILEEIAEATDLREGPEGVRSILGAIASGFATTAAMARAALLPVPVAAAVRRELEARGLLAREGGRAVFTEAGAALAGEILGRTELHGEPACPVCPACGGTGVEAAGREWEDILAIIKEFHSRKPPVDVSLDQSYATPETSLRRALYMLERGGLAGRSLAVLGDDDLLSIAASLVGRKTARPPLRVTVFEVDPRLVDLLSGISGDAGLEIEIVPHDLKEPLPDWAKGAFDVVETDPPYTVAGLTAFLERAVEALRPGILRQLYLSFGHQDPVAMLEVHSVLQGMGLVPRAIIPGFNRYEGSAVLGGVGQMIFAVTAGRPVYGRAASSPEAAGPAKPAREAPVPERGGRTAPSPRPFPVEGRPFYSGDRKAGSRPYRCRACGKTVEVGRGRRHPTIEALKEAGCPLCGGKVFRLY
ncbi:MAG: bis-aminopropyl spermidine synthase family protein [Firmicutes bacterium]|nr:bis-aminopropyl spermidine synthase family protein [Bacillota bacterium]